MKKALSATLLVIDYYFLKESYRCSRSTFCLIMSYVLALRTLMESPSTPSVIPLPLLMSDGLLHSSSCPEAARAVCIAILISESSCPAFGLLFSENELFLGKP